MSGIVNIHGKQYKTVALRVSEFREKHPISEGWSIQTSIYHADDQSVIIQASILHNGAVMAQGFAEEVRTERGINSTSALENCETSAIGRALACAGFGGDEYASADEVANAISQQNRPRPERNGRPVSNQGQAPTQWLNVRDKNGNLTTVGREVLSQVKDGIVTIDELKQRYKINRKTLDELANPIVDDGLPF